MRRVVHTITVIAVLGVVTTAGAFGQGRGRGPGGGFDIDHYMADLTERLSLTDEQAAQIKPIQEAHWETMRNMMMEARESGDMQSAMAKRGELQEENDLAIEALLNEEQVEAYRQLREEQNERQSQRRRPPDRL